MHVANTPDGRPNYGNSLVARILEGARLNAILIAAIELRLSSYLGNGALSLAELANKAGISVRGCQAIADGMVAMHLWRLSDGRYSNGQNAREALVPESPNYVGDEHPDLFRSWLSTFAIATEAVRTGRPVLFPNDPDQSSFWPLLTQALARRDVNAVLEVLESLNVDRQNIRVLDVGGGAAAMFSHKLLGMNPLAHVTQLDCADVNILARDAMSAFALSDRFDAIDTDILSHDFGVEIYDAVILSNILHLMSDSSALELVQRAARCLRCGGQLLIVDWVCNDGRAAPPAALVFNFTMLLMTESGRTYEQSDVRSMLQTSGLIETSWRYTSDGGAVIIAEKPTKDDERSMGPLHF